MSVPFYLAGLDLRGRRVVVVGAGRVAARRIARLVEAGADVQVVAPEASEPVHDLARQGVVQWTPRAVEASDLEGAWYALACTNDPTANELVAREAKARRVFCVRADCASGGTARTPAVGIAQPDGLEDGLLVGVLGTGAQPSPRASAQARDVAVAAVDAADEVTPLARDSARNEGVRFTVEVICYVADQARSRAFYRTVLGQEPALDVPGMTAFDLDGVRLGLMPAADMASLVPGIEVGTGQRAELYVRHPDADAILARVEQAGGRMLCPVEPRPWGESAGYALDPDGHVLAFASA